MTQRGVFINDLIIYILFSLILSVLATISYYLFFRIISSSAERLKIEVESCFKNSTFSPILLKKFSLKVGFENFWTRLATSSKEP
jgi:hypothetical protein